MRVLRSVLGWFQGIDAWVAKTHPRLYVTDAHKLFPAALSAALLATWAGRMTPGRIDQINDTDGVTVALFFLGLLLAVIWMLRQWQRRANVPRGCAGTIMWSAPASFVCVASFFSPAVCYSHSNAARIRAMFPITPVVDSLGLMCSSKGGHIGKDGDWAATDIGVSMMSKASGIRRSEAMYADARRALVTDKSYCPEDDASSCLRIGYGFTWTENEMLLKCDDLDEFTCDGRTRALPKRGYVSAADVFGQGRLGIICAEVRKQSPEIVPLALDEDLAIGEHPRPNPRAHKGARRHQEGSDQPTVARMANVRVLHYRRSPAGIQETWRDGTDNIYRLLKAHDAVHTVGMLRSFESVVPVVLLVVFMGAIIALAPYARWRIVLLHSLVCVFAIVLLEAFSPMLARTTQQKLHEALPFLVTLPPFLTLVLLLPRVRRPIHEVLLVSFWLSPFFVLLLWSRAWMTEFLWAGPRKRMDMDFFEARGLVCSLVLIGVLTLASTSMLPILDRYRNLPEK